MKKILIILTLITLITLPTVNAKTLDDYQKEAKENLEKQAKTNEKKALTEDEKKEATKKKDDLTKQVNQLEEDINELNKEIENYQNNIKLKDKEIKEVVKFAQVSDDKSEYLEYIFGANNFTDFIYRLSVAEQLSSYNDKLMKEYNEDVTNLQNKQKELNDKKKELDEKQKELDEVIAKLSNEISELNDTVISYQDEYKMLEETINNMKKDGCQGSDTLESCKAKVQASIPQVTITPSNNNSNKSSNSSNSNNKSNNNSSNRSNNNSSNNSDNSSKSSSNNQSSSSSSDTQRVSSGFLIPLEKGRVTQDYKGPTVHNAIDIQNYYGAPVYPMAPGKVVRAGGDWCGENSVIILHNVNGKMYTTAYWHLSSLNVSNGTNVTAYTKIGTEGGLPSVSECSTGTHVDIKLFTGAYAIDFKSLTGTDGKRHNTNPRQWLTQLPPVGGSFYNR